MNIQLILILILFAAHFFLPFIEYWALTELGQIKEVQLNSMSTVGFVLVVKYGYMVFVLALRSFLSERYMFNLILNMVRNWVFNRNHIPTNKDFSDINELIGTEANIIRSKFIGPFFNTLVDAFTLLVVAVFVLKNQEINVNVIIATLLFVILIYIVFYTMKYLASRRYLAQKKFVDELYNYLYSLVTSNLYISRPSKRVFSYYALESFISQSLNPISMTLIGVFLLLLLPQSALDMKGTVEIGLASLGYMVVIIYPLPGRLSRNISKLASGYISLKQLYLMGEKRQPISYPGSKLNVNIVKDKIKKSEKGLFKVGGPNGSGKSTLFWRIFKELNNQSDFTIAVYAQSLRSGGAVSGGQSSFADISKILNKDIDVLLLDEPFNHLDKSKVELLCNMILDKSSTSLIFIIDHSNKIEGDYDYIVG